MLVQGKTSVSDTGGAVTVSSGVGKTSSGALHLRSAVAGTSGVSGIVYLSTGDSTGGPPSGHIYIGTRTGVKGRSGSIKIGAGLGDSGAAGAIVIQAGTSTDALTGDQVSIASGVSTARSSGSLSFFTTDAPGGNSGFSARARLTAATLANCSLVRASLLVAALIPSLCLWEMAAAVLGANYPW